MDRPGFGPVRQIDAGVLNVGYVEVGAADGQPVVLLHGWPYDIHSYADAAPALGDDDAPTVCQGSIWGFESSHLCRGLAVV